MTERGRRACGTVLRPAPTVRSVPGAGPAGREKAVGPPAPALFEAAVAALGSVRPRPEIVLDTVPAPQRLAPWTHALSAEVVEPGADPDDAPVATARLVLLHDPDGQQAWDGVLRLVVYVRAELDADVAGDPLLPEVGWSWLTEALDGVPHTALGGTVTQTSSARFGDIAGPTHAHEIELRASWTPLDSRLDVHADAFCVLLAAAAGLPPLGVTSFAR